MYVYTLVEEHFKIIDIDLDIWTPFEKKVIVMPWVVRMYVEIIHELYRVDYLMYRWTNMV